MKKIILFALLCIAITLFGCTGQELPLAPEGIEPKEEQPVEEPGDTKSSDAKVSDLPNTITREEFARHDEESDCWILYEGNVYDYSDVTKRHPNIPDTFYSHCGKDTYEAAAKARHPESSAERVANYGAMIGELI